MQTSVQALNAAGGVVGHRAMQASRLPPGQPLGDGPGAGGDGAGGGGGGGVEQHAAPTQEHPLGAQV